MLALFEIESALRAVMEPGVRCDYCDADVTSGDVVVLDGMVLGAECCAWMRAAAILDPLNVSCWTPVEIEGGRKEYEEAREVVRALLARIDARLGRTA